MREIRSSYASVLCGVAVAAFWLGACGATRAAEPNPLRITNVFATTNGWTIGSNDVVKGCLAAATYRDQTTVWVGVDSERMGFVSFTNPAWRSIEPGKDYHIDLRAGSSRWNGSFVGVDRTKEKGIIAYGVKPQFLVDFVRAGALGVFLDGSSITNLPLNGSLAALQSVLQCARSTAKSDSDTPSGAQPKQAEKPSDNDHSSSGTGFFISNAGHVMTNNHVIRGCKEFWVTQSTDPRQSANVVAKDEINDLAILSTSLKPAALPAFNTHPRVGETIYVYGFPLSSILATSGNFTLGNITAAAGLNDDTRMLQISAPVQPGNSGGPVVDSSGNVTGVLVSKLNAMRVAKITDDIPQNVNFAIKSSIAVNFLESNNIQPNITVVAQKFDAPTLAEQAKEFTVRITCR